MLRPVQAVGFQTHKAFYRCRNGSSLQAASSGLLRLRIRCVTVQSADSVSMLTCLLENKWRPYALTVKWIQKLFFSNLSSAIVIFTTDAGQKSVYPTFFLRASQGHPVDDVVTSVKKISHKDPESLTSIETCRFPMHLTTLANGRKILAEGK